MKFDVAPPPETDTPFLSGLRGEKDRGSSWFVAGSTHEGEEEAVLSAFGGARSVNRSVRLLLAPRPPERFDAGAELCGRRGGGGGRKTKIAHGGGERAAPG